MIVVTSIQNVEYDVNGVSIFIYDLVPGLIENGFQVKVITPYSEKNKVIYFYKKVIYLLTRIWLRTRISLFSYWVVILKEKIIKHLIQNMENISLIQCNDLLSANAALEYSKGKIPVVLTTHFYNYPWQEFVDGEFIKSSSYAYTLLKKRMIKVFENPHLNFAFVSKSNKKLISSYIRQDNIKNTVIYQGVKLHEKSKNNLNTGTPIILNIGMVCERKNQIFLVEIAKELQDENVKFVVIGPQNEEEMKKINNLMEKYKLKEKLVFTGQLNHDKIFDYLQKAFLYLSVAKAESFGRTLVEAMSTQTPVMSLHYDAVDEILPDNCEMVLPQSISAKKAVEKIKLLLNNAEYRKKINDEQFNRYRSAFMLEKMVDGYALYFNKLINANLENRK